MAIETITKRSVGNEVFEQMKNMVLNGEWKPGDKIPSENELKDMFQVSRVTIREALKKLNSYGIIETIHGSGTFIKQLNSDLLFNPMMITVYFKTMDERAIRDMMEFRNMIETESALLATNRATEEDLQKLQRIYALMHTHKGNIEKFAKYDLEFHHMISDMTKNAVIMKFGSLIWNFMREYFNTVVLKTGTDKGLYYHGEIIAAMKNRDAALSRELMANHLNATYMDFFNSEYTDAYDGGDNGMHRMHETFEKME